jgi:hypothetical protein
VRCDHCGHDVPEGVFCTRCGAHQGTTGEPGDPKTRIHRYAAHPAEHVLEASVFTTLFPHLGHQKIHEFRWAFLAGLAGVLLLYIAGLITSAILLAALLVPALYMIYLYETQVYRDEPMLVLGYIVGGGVAAGLIVTVAERLVYHPYASVSNPLGSASLAVGTLLAVGLAVPLAQELVKAFPALLLPKRVAFPETVDGLVFGIASGLAFSAASTVVGFSGALASLPVQVSPAGWIYTLANVAILQPLLQGGATGLVVAAIWRYRRGRLTRTEIAGVGLAVLAHIAFAGGAQLMRDAEVSGLFILVWQAAIVGGLLIYIRFVLHHALLEEAAHLGYAETVCPACHTRIVASGFCPHCGIALSAAPNTVKRRRRPRTDVPTATLPRP